MARTNLNCGEIGDRGMALLLVVSMIALLSVVIIRFSQSMQLAVIETAHFQQSVLMESMAQSGLDIGLAVLRQDDIRRVILAAGALLLIALTMFFLNALQVLVMEYAGQRTMHTLRMRIFNHIQRQSIDFFSKNPVGRLVTRATNDIQNMHELFTSVLAFLFKDLFLIIGVAVVLTMLSWRLP